MPPDSAFEACAACGGTDLRPHLRVAGELGQAGMIPTTDQFARRRLRRRGLRGLRRGSSFASAFARDRVGADVRTGGLFDTELPQRHFAGVTMGDVIEHLVRPDAALDRIGGLLAPGGVLWLALPDAGSRIARALGRRWWSVIPTHVQYFTGASNPHAAAPPRL